MKTTVDDLLSLRAHDPAGLSRMVMWSLTIHVAAVVLAALAPRLGWISRKPPEHVLVITLGGSKGPTTGPTTIGGRPVDQVAPEPKRPEPIKPVATKPDVMTVPLKAAPPKKEPPAPPKEQPKAPARMAQPASTGRQVTPGNSRAETGVIGMGTGLQLGGGGVGGAPALDDFCCKAYLNTVRGLIEAKWDPKQDVRGTAVAQFTIQRDGTITDVSIPQASHFLLRTASQRPFYGLKFPPLPPEYTSATITLRMTFEYQ